MKSLSRLLALLSAGLLVFAAGCDSVPGPDFETGDYPGSGSENTASKAAIETNLAHVDIATLNDGTGDWTLDFEDATDVAGNTRFAYTLSPPDEEEECDDCGGAEDVVAEDSFSVVIPACASYQGSSHLPVQTGSTLKWAASQFPDVDNDLWLDFATPAGMLLERIGVVEVGLDVVDDPSPVSAYVKGPCDGIYDLEGTVFFNDTSDDAVVNDDQDPGEPGIPNVEVAVQEYDDGVWDFGDTPRQSVLTDANGDYSMSVFVAPVPDAPTEYRVVITRTSTLPGAINLSLFGGIFMPSCDDDCPTVEAPPAPADTLIAKVATLTGPAEIDFGFEVDLEGAVDKFDAGTLFSDGLSREYWKQQAKPNKKEGFPVEYTKAEFLYLLNCSGPFFAHPGPIECIFDPTGNPNDFAGDDDSSINEILKIGGRRDLKDAQQILNKDEGLKASSDAKPGTGKYTQLQKELQQEIFVALLNFTIGRGVCVGDLDGGGRCLAFDEAATRLVIENAITVLIASDFTVIKKASSGSVSGNSALLDRMN